MPRVGDGRGGVGREVVVVVLMSVSALVSVHAQARPAPAPAAAAARAPLPTPPPLMATPPVAHVPPLPDPTGWGAHVLAMPRGPDGSIWVGTYGDGIFVLPPNATAWYNIRASNDSTAHSISWDFVHAFAFQGRDVWYRTVGN